MKQIVFLAFGVTIVSCDQTKMDKKVEGEKVMH